MYVHMYVPVTIITVRVCVQKADLLHWPLKLPSGGLASGGATYTVRSIVCVYSADSQQPPGGGDAAGVCGGGGGGSGGGRVHHVMCDMGSSGRTLSKVLRAEALHGKYPAETEHTVTLNQR